MIRSIIRVGVAVTMIALLLLPAINVIADPYGVELTMAPEEQSKLMFIHPQEIKSGNVSVKNVGDLDDTIYLDISVDFMGHEGVGWDAWLEGDEFILSANTSVQTKVYIRGPDQGNPNDFIEILLNATAAGNSSKSDTVTFRTYLVIDHDISIEVSDNVHTVMPSQSTVFSGVVKNTGDVDEDIILEIVDLPADWDVSLSNSSFEEVHPNESKDFDLTMTAPSDAVYNETGLVTIKAYVQGSPSVKDDVTCKAVVSQLCVGMNIEEPTKYLDPGNSTEFTIDMFTDCELSNPVDVDLEIISGTGDWGADLDKASVTLGSHDTKTVTLTVQAPSNALAGTRLVVKVAGSLEGSQFDDVSATAIVKLVHEINITTTLPSQMATPGKVVIFPITVKNDGNGVEKIDLELEDNPMTWEYSIKHEDQEVSTLLLETGEEAKLQLQVTIPFSYEIKDPKVIFQFVAISESGYQNELSLEIVLFEPDLKITRVTYDPMNITVDTTVTFEVVVGNLGIFDSSNVKINFYGNEALCASTTIEQIPAGTSRTAVFTWMPDTTGDQELRFEIEYYDKIQDRFFLSLTVQKLIPDVGISDVEYETDGIKVDKDTKIKVSVVNNGTVDAKNVTVNFYENDALVNSTNIESLPTDSDITVEFDWKPTKKGDKDLKFELVYDGHVTGIGDNDDLFTETVSVQEEQRASSSGLDVILLIVFVVIIIIVVVVVIVAITMKKRGKGRTPVEATQMPPPYQQYPVPGQLPQQPPYQQYPVPGQLPQQPPYQQYPAPEQPPPYKPPPTPPQEPPIH